MEINAKNNKMAIIIGSIIAVIVLAIGISYAIFSAQSSTTTQQITSGNLSIGFQTGNILRTTGITPIKEVDITEKATEINFTVTNTGNIVGYFDISLTEIEIDEELKDENFKWRLLEGETIINEGNFVGASTTKLLQRSIVISGEASKTYKILVWIQENNAPQNEMQGKSLKAKVTVNGKDRLTKFALSEEPVLADTVSGNTIQNLKIYGNTVNEESVGTLDSTTNKYNIEVTASGKNLFDISTLSRQFGNENQEISNNVIKIYSNSIGTWKANYYKILVSPNNLFGKTITVSYDIMTSSESTTALRIGYQVPAGSWKDIKLGTSLRSPSRFQRTSTTATLPVSKPDDMNSEYFLFSLYSNSSATVTSASNMWGKYKNIQIEYGSEATSYISYEEPVTYTISLNAPLRSNGDKKDYIDFEQGKVIRWIAEDGSVLTTAAEESITLPEIKTLNGTTRLSTNAAVKPTIEGRY